MSPSSSPVPDVSYQALLSRVRKQQLRLLLILSPPRTGSTALEKALCQRFQADAQLNEPAAQFLAGEARVSETFKTIHRAVEELEARVDTSRGSLTHQPFVVVVKAISQQIGPAEEWRAWQHLFEKKLVLVRHPSLALESLLPMTLGLVEMLLGRAEAQPERWLSPHHASLLPAAATASWQGLVEHLKRSRDFRCLESERLRSFWCESNSMFGTRGLQTDVWMHQTQRCRMNRTLDEIAAHAGTPASRLSTLPADFLRPFADRHFGWSALRDLWEGIHPSDSSVAVLDFTSLQLNPEALLEKLGRFFGLGPCTSGPARAPLQTTAYDAREAALPGITHLLFGNAKEQDTILPPQKTSLPSEFFPLFLQEQLEDATRVYNHLLADHRQLQAPPT